MGLWEGPHSLIKRAWPSHQAEGSLAAAGCPPLAWSPVEQRTAAHRQETLANGRQPTTHDEGILIIIIILRPTFRLDTGLKTG